MWMAFALLAGLNLFKDFWELCSAVERRCIAFLPPDDLRNIQSIFLYPIDLYLNSILLE